MKLEMAKFLMEQYVGTSRHLHGIESAIAIPYGQWPRHQPKLPYMDRPLFQGHKTYPELSRRGAPFGYVAARAAPPIAAVAVPYAVGLGVSYEIAGKEGVDDYNQFLTEPKHMPFRASWSLARLYQHYLS